MKIRQFIKTCEKIALDNNKEDSSVVLLLMHVLNYSSSNLFNHLDDEIKENEINRFNDLFNKYLFDNEPVQYLIGTVCFYGYDFNVNKNVLIPRFETEELVENVLYRYDLYFKSKEVNVCDVATGSGCIGITLKLEEPKMNVTISDISFEALEVAKENSIKLNASVNILQGDMLTPFKEKYDILVSNPPYIPDNEIVDTLVKDNEPNIALFGGKDGLKFYNIILRDAKRILKDDAMIAFEHGYDKSLEIEKIAKIYFPDCEVEHLKDLENKDRMTFIYLGAIKDEFRK